MLDNMQEYENTELIQKNTTENHLAFKYIIKQMLASLKK